MRDNLIKVTNMEKENIITSKVNFILEIGRTTLKMELDNIFMKMERDTVANSRTI